MKGKGWPTSEGKQDTPPTKNNMATISRLDDINSKKNNVSSGSNKPPGWEWDTIKGRGWGWTGDTFITDPECRKELYGDYEHLWINFSKPPWNNRDNSYNPYASSNECSSESSSECSYNHKSKNKK